jgi:hypothetical protein
MAVPAPFVGASPIVGASLLPPTIDFRPQFGCEFLTVPSMLFIDLTTLNRSGVRQQSTLSATLR